MKKKAEVNITLEEIIGLVLIGIVLIVVIRWVPALMGIGGNDAATINNFARLTDAISEADDNTAETIPIAFDADSVLIGFNKDTFGDGNDWACADYSTTKGFLGIGSSEKGLKRPSKCFSQPCICICRDAGSKITSESCEDKDAKCKMFPGYEIKNAVTNVESLGCSQGVFIPGSKRASGKSTGMVYFLKDPAKKIIYIDDGEDSGYVSSVYAQIGKTQ